MFASQDRVIVKRTSGKFEEWAVIHWLDGQVVVGAETRRGDARKQVPVDTLKAWQAEAEGQNVRCRPLTEGQIEQAFQWAQTYAEQEAQENPT